MTFRGVSIVALAVVGVASAACSSAAPPVDSLPHEHDRAVVVDEELGTYSFYGGVGIGDVIARDGASAAENGPHAFFRLRVPASFVGEALVAPMKIKTASFEATDPSIEAAIRTTAHTAANPTGAGAREWVTERYHPGDPWVTGYAQVGLAPDQSLVGLFDFTYWHKYPDGVLAENIFSTGLLGDDQMPPLLYGGEPASWPPLPDNWK